jgi:hypothetical protein
MLEKHVEEKLGCLQCYFRTPLGRIEAEHATAQMHDYIKHIQQEIGH